jgi:RNA polymerase sigma-70 factor (ECF subfamily)
MNGDARGDAELIAAASAGDNDAFGVLVRRYIRPATLLATHLLGGREAAEDVVQESFIVVYRKIQRFDQARPFAPWCFGIVRRLATNHRARDQRRARLLRMWNWVRGRDMTTPHQEQMLNAALDGATSRRAMQELSPMQRACFELVMLHGLSNQEVALMHGITESTVRQHVFRARAVLKDVLIGGRDRPHDE